MLAHPNYYDIISFCQQQKLFIADIQANVAQLAERLIRNEQVSGSIPLIGSIYSAPRNAKCFSG
jgi:hypothetical protein